MSQGKYQDPAPNASAHERICKALTRVVSQSFELGKAAQGLLVLEQRLRVRAPEGPALLRAMLRDISDGIDRVQAALDSVQP